MVNGAQEFFEDDKNAKELDGTLEEKDRNRDALARFAARGLAGGGIH